MKFRPVYTSSRRIWIQVYLGRSLSAQSPLCSFSSVSGRGNRARLDHIFVCTGCSSLSLLIPFTLSRSPTMPYARIVSPLILAFYLFCQVRAYPPSPWRLLSPYLRVSLQLYPSGNCRLRAAFHPLLSHTPPHTHSNTVPHTPHTPSSILG